MICARAVGDAARRAPSIISVRAEIRGKAAHAGFEPENGIHAIFAAANAVSRLCMGHVDEETTFNIGTIQGGTATNIVPDCCVLTGEIRSYDHGKALETVRMTERIFTEEAQKINATAEVTSQIHLIAYQSVTDFQKPVKNGSDNNSFAKNGIEGLVLSNGMYNAHSTREYTTFIIKRNFGRILLKIVVFAYSYLV